MDKVPEMICINMGNGRKADTINLQFTDETALGEPVAWIYLSDGTSLEICHEEEGLKEDEQFYSIRHHCSDKDFEEDKYHSTMGVIQHMCSMDAGIIAEWLTTLLMEQLKKNITVSDYTGKE